MHRTLLSIAVTFASIHSTLADVGKPATFEEQVRPILKAHCFECHGEGKKLKGGLDVRLKRLMVQGGDSGPAFETGKAKSSLLIERLESGEMPPSKKKLTKDEIALIARWIDGGAPTAREEPKTLASGFQLSDDDKRFWSFQPIRTPAFPRVRGQERVRMPIDAFLLAKLEAKGLTFAADADRRTLIRRAYFDLLGLPPTPREVDDFVRDDHPAAYEKLLDRLLDSPHYGERWGRHWLDVAGYADSEGYSGDDLPRQSAFRYRDYVIRAFGANMPFDRFIQEQLAGDEMVAPPYHKLSEAGRDKLIATGFLRMAPDGTGGKAVNIKEACNQTIADTIQIVGTSLLGLTLHCAQCHNHRYDPIPHTDYFRVRAVFEPAFDTTKWRAPAAREIFIDTEEKRKAIAAAEDELKKAEAEQAAKAKMYVKAIFDKAFTQVPDDEKDAVQRVLKLPIALRSPAERELLERYKGLLVDAKSVGLYDKNAGKELEALQTKARKLRTTKPAADSVRALTEIPGQAPPTHLFERGDIDQPRDEIKPGHLAILASFNLPAIPERDAALPTTGRRLAFARSLTSSDHPLTARVLVNRFWMHHFGTGIVATPGDFGVLGERPTHPELLDWLAHDFIAGGWKLKRFHKQVMLSTAYRQSSVTSPAARSADPDNRLLASMPIRRLEAEIVRDAMLAASDKLNPKQFGPPIPICPDLTGQIVIGVDTRDPAGRPTGKVVPLNGEEFRRSVYVQVRRSKPLAMLETFDGAAVSPNCDRRKVTTVTPQALMLMNSQDVIDLAGFLARRLEKEADGDTRLQVTLAWSYALSRAPSEDDLARALQFMDEQTRFYETRKDLPAGHNARGAALTNLCQAVLCCNEFLYVD